MCYNTGMLAYFARASLFFFPRLQNMIKRLIKDVIAQGGQALGLPHNKTTAQIRAIKATFVESELDRQRIDLIAAASGRAEEEVESYIRDFRQKNEDNESEAAGQWVTIGGSKMSVRDRITLHTLVRALQPRVVVETGVAGGASATVILQNIASEGGRLVSIDIAGPHASRYGELIPDPLRSAWELRLQDSAPLLPGVLTELQPLDLFLHDSQHTVSHMRWEYELAWESLRPGGCLASHDVIMTTAFEDFKRRHEDTIVCGGTIGNFGFWMKSA